MLPTFLSKTLLISVSVRSISYKKKQSKIPTKISVGGLSFFICGYAFAFGSGSSFIGYNHFVLTDLDPSKYAFFFFQVRTYK